jgi:hypothetical protein
LEGCLCGWEAENAVGLIEEAILGRVISKILSQLLFLHEVNAEEHQSVTAGLNSRSIEGLDSGLEVFDIDLNVVISGIELHDALVE